MITSEIIASVLPKSRAADRASWAAILTETCSVWGIDTPASVSMFLAQVGHESGQLRVMVENLNYSAEGLLNTWPGRFTPEAAAQYARQPARIANYVYANRGGNGDAASGDGWRYRGRGLIQLTGRANYARYAKEAARDVVSDPAMVERPDIAADAAGWFWAKANLNRFADAGHIEECTRRVNGGLKGLDDRRAIWERARRVLGVADVG